jgi:hypothetical protein
MPTELDPKLLIGIGTSGMYILENVQRYYYEAFKENKPKNVEYLFLETNKDNKIGVTPLENEIKRIYLDLDELGPMIKELRKEPSRKWLPSENTAVQAGLGAGGIRCIGRVALQGRNKQHNNFINVIDNLKEAKQKLAKHNTAKPTVYIFGSLTGGTGSSVFIDLAYLVKSLFPNDTKVYGLFLLPPMPSGFTDNEVIYANAYGAIKDLHSFNKPGAKYVEKWPNGIKAEFNAPPFELSQFISQDYSDGSAAINNLSGLYKIAGIYLFLQICGMQEKREQRIVDCSSNGVLGRYGIYGISAIEYPKDQIQEMLALRLSEELFKRWTDSSHYFNGSENTPINLASIEETVYESFSKIIDEAFESVNSVGGDDVIKKLQNVAVDINRKIIDDPGSFLLKYFGTSETDKLYAKIYYRISNAKDAIINGIYDETAKALNMYENLFYTQSVINSFNKAIEKCLDYFQGLGISDSRASWDNFLRERIVDILSKLYKPILEQDSVLKDRLAATLELLKMHLIIPALQDIKNNMTSKSFPLVSANKKRILPKVDILDNITIALTEVIGKSVEADSSSKKEKSVGHITLNKRKGAVYADINDTSIPVKRIYKLTNFDDECQNAYSKYRSRFNRGVTKEDIIGQENLYEYLTIINSNSTIINDLYTKSLRSYRQKISREEIVEDYDVVEALRTDIKLGIEYAQRSLANLIKLDTNYIKSHPKKMPRFIAGYDEGKLMEFIQAMRNQSFTEFEDNKDGILQLENLKNMVVFYNEDPLVNPLVDISYSKEMKELYERIPDSITDPLITPEIWKIYRNAYLPAEQAITNEIEKSVEKDTNENNS